MSGAPGSRRDADRVVELDDGVVVEREAPGEGVYEGKLTTLFRRQEWEAGIPLYYVVQCQHYYAVTGHQWASLGVFIAGERQPLRARDMLRHESFISKHVNMCGEWWERHVVKDTPPPLDDRKRTESMIRRAYPDATPKLIAQLDEAFAAKQRRLSEVESAIKKLEAERQQIRNEVMAAIGEAYNVEGMPTKAQLESFDVNFVPLTFIATPEARLKYYVEATKFGVSDQVAFLQEQGYSEKEAIAVLEAVAKRRAKLHLIQATHNNPADPTADAPENMPLEELPGERPEAATGRAGGLRSGVERKAA